MTNKYPKGTFQYEIYSLFNDACIKLGFCDRIEIHFNNIFNNQSYSENQFINDLFKMEMMDPEYEKQLVIQARKLFYDHFGKHEINKSDFDLLL